MSETTVIRNSEKESNTNIVNKLNQGDNNEEILNTNTNNKELSCEECSIKVTSLKILLKHLEGRKHRMKVERKGKIFTCDLCDVVANSQTQLDVHLNSSKHKSRLLKKECGEFTSISVDMKSIWIIAFCLTCVFLNLFLLFEIY